MSDAPQVIGFEGRSNGDHPISWGAAAIWDGERVINACSGGSCSMEEWQINTAVTALDAPIEVPPSWIENNGALVLKLSYEAVSNGVRMHSPYYSKQKQGLILCYPNREAMLLEIATHKQRMMASFQQMVKYGLTLSGHDLEFNALNTVVKLLDDPKDSQFIKTMSKAILRSAEDEKKFETIFYGAQTAEK
jgi:hypothetical protein